MNLNKIIKKQLLSGRFISNIFWTVLFIALGVVDLYIWPSRDIWLSILLFVLAFILFISELIVTFSNISIDIETYISKLEINISADSFIIKEKKQECEELSLLLMRSYKQHIDDIESMSNKIKNVLDHHTLSINKDRAWCSHCEWEEGKQKQSFTGHLLELINKVEIPEVQ